MLPSERARKVGALMAVVEVIAVCKAFLTLAIQATAASFAHSQNSEGGWAFGRRRIRQEVHGNHGMTITEQDT